MQLQSFFAHEVARFRASFSHHKRIEQLRGDIFVNEKWLRLFASESLLDFKIVGNLDKYLLIFVTNKGDDEPGWFSKQFFDSLQPHEVDFEKNEVSFRSGLVLNVADVLERPEASTVDIERLLERKMFCRPRTWYYSHKRSVLKKGTAKVVEDRLIIDVYVR